MSKRMTTEQMIHKCFDDIVTLGYLHRKFAIKFARAARRFVLMEQKQKYEHFSGRMRHG